VAKTTYKDKKSGKSLTKTTLDNYKPIKDASKPKIVKEGKVYKVAKNIYKEGK